MDRISDKELRMLEECQSANDWGKACDTIKQARGNEYPDDWWAKVNQTGMMDRIMSRWGEDSELKIKEFATKRAMLKYLKPSPSEYRYDLDDMDTDGLS